MKRLQTRVEPYGAQLHLALDEQQWAALRRRFGDGIDETPIGMGHCQSVLDTESLEFHVVIALDLTVLPHELAAMRCAVHEAVHAAGMVLDHIRQDYDGASEALAYLVEWIAGWLWEGLAARYPKEAP